MKHDVIIVGGGPAGSTAGISLATRGYRVLLLESKKFPRDKLCGEFVAPECVPVLERLGVCERIEAAHANRINHATLASSSGEQLSVALDQLPRGGGYGFGVSRAAFDGILLDQARASGVDVVERFRVKSLLTSGDRIVGVTGVFAASEQEESFSAEVVVDASGRKRTSTNHLQSALFAFKTHLSDVDGITDEVELYFYPSGYGGVIKIEDGLFNLCLITTQDVARHVGHDANRLIEATVMKNRLAQEKLRRAKPESKLIGVGPLDFGRKRAADGLLAVGDAAGQIDPFVGQGILIALESGETAAEVIDDAFSHGDPAHVSDSLFREYEQRHRRQFARRFLACRVARQAAFLPVVGNGLISLLLSSQLFRRAAIHLTRW